MTPGPPDRVDLLLLSVRPTHARCRLPQPGGEVVRLKPVPATRQVLRTLVPGQILSVVPGRGWNPGGRGLAEGCVAGRRTDLGLLAITPLQLEDVGPWDPSKEYWGEEGERIDPCFLPILAAGKRPAYEMEQVVPGVDWSDFEPDDPILDAVERADAGDRRGARAILHALLERDLRCLDAYAHLGNLALREDDPDVALGFYQMGVDIAGLSVPPDAPGVLPWGFVDNRPFLRCLQGLALSLWRLGRFDEARAVLERILWFNPSDNQGVRFILPAVERCEPWTDEEG